MTTLKFILEEEGFREKPYLDTEGVTTFGHGLTYITKEESEKIVQQRVYDIIGKLTIQFNWFYRMTEIRRTVIVSMVYQLGFRGFSNFKKMIKALEEEDYDEASVEMLDSKWARQTPNRAKRQFSMMTEG